jgi:uncharacterized protein
MEVTPLRAIPVIVETLPPEGEAYALVFETGEVDAALTQAGWGEVAAAGPLRAELRLLRSGSDVFALGRFGTRARYHCVRCLTEFEESVGGEFEVTFAAEPVAEAGERELHREDLELEPLRAGTLDLAQVVREQLLLALRPHPVCRESCLGLCPRCGADRNQTSCGCPGGDASSPFGALKAWDKARRT